ncbi:MAG: VWA domain-containing protein [Desulfurococcales archaeon]|nr:VWA domain-containing protein [Desulfurococcales archaeon]MCE4605286.1 VWA domain-containing protein [Desulfurococcales archaeon]
MRLIEVEDLVESIPELVSRLRSMGYTIGTSQAVDAVKIIESYSSLRRTSKISEDEAIFLLDSVLTVRGISRTDIGEALRHSLSGKRVRERAERILGDIEERLSLIGAKPGLRVSKRSLKGKKKERKEKLKAYLELRKIGVIRGKGGVERVVDMSMLHGVAWRLAREGYESLEDAIREVGMGNMDYMLMEAEARLEVDPESLSRLDGKRLLKLGEAASRKGNYRLLRMVGEEVSRRVLSGRRLDPQTARFILERAGIMTPDHDKMLYMTGQGKSISKNGRIDIDNILGAVQGLGEEEAANLVSKTLKIVSEDEAKKLLSRVDPYLLWRVRRTSLKGEEADLVRAASYAANAVREAMLYAESGDPARADMARDYIDRSRSILNRLGNVMIGRLSKGAAEDLLETAYSILSIASMESPSPGNVSRILGMAGFERAVRVLRGMYRAGGEWRSIAEWALERLIYMVSSREGLRPLPKWRLYDTGPGRVDVRRSVYGVLRRSSRPLVYRRRLRSNLVSMALDVSGSMESYSIWALGMASMFARSLDRVVLFASTLTVYQGPFGRRDIARILLSASFKGYTDIYSGILEASKSRAKRVIVITDLAQTIESGDPLEAALSASRTGKKLVFIVPLKHDEELRSRLEDSGFNVVIVSSARQAARQVLRAFSR